MLSFAGRRLVVVSPTLCCAADRNPLSFKSIIFIGHTARFDFEN